MGAILPLEGMVMEPEAEMEMGLEARFCPECGAEEGGFFCRTCGALLRGEEMVLCPRCHQVVPDGEFCNQCGQNLGGIALNLRQLALAGDDFWVTTAPSTPIPPPESAEQSLFEPDESVFLADAQLPDWLRELSTESVPPEVQAHVHPSLQPIEEERRPPQQGSFVIAVFLLLGLVLLGLVGAVIFLIVSGGI